MITNYVEPVYTSKVEKISNAQFNGTMGVKLAAIAGLTGGTMAACYFSPLGRTVTAGAKIAWLKIKDFIASVLPSWFSAGANSNGVTILFKIVL